MKKVLMIAYHYPPIGGVGIIRTLKFTKYLREFGWSPYVLTVKNRDRFYTASGNDEIPGNVKVFRVWNCLNNLSLIEGGLRRFGITSKLFTPDIYKYWNFLAIKKGEKIIKKEKIDMIYVSCPPYSSAIIGARLKEKTNIPLVIDFRDAWTLNPYSTKYIFKYLQTFDEKLENYIFQTADHIITATDGIKSDYTTKYPFIKSNITSILNGFDMDDIPRIVNGFDKFTIVYTGFFYGVQSPELLFAALEIILTKGLVPKDDLQFLWVGRNAQFVHELAKNHNILDIFSYHGPVSKKEADELLYRSHILFLIIGDTQEVSQNTTLTGKIFPYLASGKPILAIVPDGTARVLIENYSDNSYIISPVNVDEVVDAIVDAYNQWKNGEGGDEIGNKTRLFREKFNYERHTQMLADVFEELL